VLSGAVGRLFAVVEAHPDLKADATLVHLTEELVSTENRIGFARQAYNDSVTDYNNGVERFPENLVASAFSFRPATLLRATRSVGERAPVAAFRPVQRCRRRPLAASQRQARLMGARMRAKI
jgi:LemA protein